MDSLLVYPDGRAEVMRISQQEASQVLGGDVMLVGAVDEMRAFAVGLRDTSTHSVNVACTDPLRFDIPVHGPVLFVATGEDGEEVDLDCAGLSTMLLRESERSLSA